MKCPECETGEMVQRKSRFGFFWGCNRFPQCVATHGAHPDGKPLGIPADKTTKQARIKAHAAFDSFWQKKGWPRGKAYAWMEKSMGLERGKGHIAMFDVKQCEALIWLCEHNYALENPI